MRAWRFLCLVMRETKGWPEDLQWLTDHWSTAAAHANQTDCVQRLCVICGIWTEEQKTDISTPMLNTMCCFYFRAMVVCKAKTQLTGSVCCFLMSVFPCRGRALTLLSMPSLWRATCLRMSSPSSTGCGSLSSQLHLNIPSWSWLLSTLWFSWWR